jgi:hypothetical protein
MASIYGSHDIKIEFKSGTYPQEEVVLQDAS